MNSVPVNIQRLCDEFEIRIVGRHIYPIPGETRATETMARICRRHGEDHLRLVLMTLAETANNAALLDETGLWTASDMLRAWHDVVESRASDWFDMWDAMPVGKLQFIAASLRGHVSQRGALGGMLHERLWREFGPEARQPDLLDDRRQPA